MTPSRPDGGTAQLFCADDPFQLTGTGVTLGHFSEAGPRPVVDFAVAARVAVDAGAPVGTDASTPVLAGLLADGLLAELAGVTGPADALVLFAGPSVHAS